MTADLRARIAEMLRWHDRDMDGADPGHEADDEYGCCADAVMAIVRPEFVKLAIERDRWRRDFFKASVQRGEVMYAQHERNEAFSASMRLVQQRDDAETMLVGVAAACRDLMLAAEKLYLDWPKPGTPEHRRAVVQAIRAAEQRLARLPVEEQHADWRPTIE